MRIIRNNMVDKIICLSRLEFLFMYVELVLKSEKTLIIDFFCFCKKVLKERIKNLYFYLASFFRFSTKKLSVNLKIQSEARQLEKENKLDFLADNIEKPANLHIEISSEKINELLAQRLICAADVRCLDAESKQCLKKLCLKTCLYNTKSYNPVPQLLENYNLADFHTKKDYD
jgi:hypothetical protein